MEKKELAEKLKRIPLFNKMDDEFFALFIPCLKVSSFEKKESIIREGEPGTDMYVLLKGCVRVNKQTASGDIYTAALLKDEYGIVFGELGLLAEDKRSATVIAEATCEIGILCSAEFNKFVDENPKFGVQLLRELSISICQKLKKSNQDMIVLYEALIGEVGGTFL